MVIDHIRSLSLFFPKQPSLLENVLLVDGYNETRRFLTSY
jgi:hypothetical protein